MAVRKIGNTWYVDIRHNRKRERVRSPENSRAGAAAYEATIKHALTNGKTLDQALQRNVPNVGSYREYAEEWYTKYVLVNNKSSEQRTKRILLDKHLLAWFGAKSLNEIGKSDIDNYKAAKLRDGLSKKTINNHLIVLSKSLHTACEWGLLENPPRIQKLPCPPPKTEYLDDVEVAAMLSYDIEPMWRLMIALGLYTGMRLGELMALDWSNIQFEAAPPQIIVSRNLVYGVFGSPKSNRVRAIPLSERLCATLIQYRMPSGLVFTRPDRPGEPLTKSMAQNALRRACKAAGIRSVGWHALRHTFATQLMARGAQQRFVQELLGHSSIAMTMRYVHHTPSLLYQTVTLLDKPTEPKKNILGQTVGKISEMQIVSP